MAISSMIMHHSMFFFSNSMKVQKKKKKSKKKSQEVKKSNKHRNRLMIIVTVLREKLIHSETIRENQTIKSDQSDGQDPFTFPSARRQEAGHLYIIHRSEDEGHRALRASSNRSMTN